MSGKLEYGGYLRLYERGGTYLGQSLYLNSGEQRQYIIRSKRISHVFCPFIYEDLKALIEKGINMSYYELTEELLPEFKDFLITLDAVCQLL